MKFTNFIKTSIPVSSLSKYNMSNLFPVRDVVLDRQQYEKGKEEEIKHQILNYEPNGTRFQSEEAGTARFSDNFLGDTRQMISRELLRRGLDDRYTDRILAQVALESNFGQSASGKYNFSGIKGKGTKRNTKEFENGEYRDVIDEFKDYNSKEEWIKDYVDLLSNSRYGHAFDLPEDQFIPYIHQQGYATDPDYVSKVHKIYDQITRMDDGGEMMIDDEPKTYKKYKRDWNDIPYGSEEQFVEFVKKHEDYKKKAYKDPNGIYTVGYGSTYLYDKNGKATKVEKGDELTEQEALEQLKYHLDADLERLRSRISNFDQFPDGVKYALRDGIYNIGETEMFNKKYKFYKALEQYNNSNDYTNGELIRQLMLRFDWNRDTSGNIGLRSGRRRAMMQDMYDWKDNENINKYTRKTYTKNPYWQWGRDLLWEAEQRKKKK